MNEEKSEIDGKNSDTELQRKIDYWLVKKRTETK